MADIEFLGDPHLGKRFVNNVPLHRRGEREAMVLRDFRQSILETTADVHITVGDLFDAAVVTYNTILEAAKTYEEAAKTGAEYVVISGNHDASRDLERSSAFDIFAKIVAPFDHVYVFKEPTVWNGIAFFPWHPTLSTETLVRQLDLSKATMAVGHWDVDERMDPHNLIPTEALAAAGVTTAYTGHDHKKRTFVRDGVTVHVVGSMQPYAHGEESDESLYVTRTLAEALDAPKDYRDKCLRIRLAPGEVLEEQIDCLQLVLQREGDAEEEIDVQLGDFDIRDLFKQAFDEEDVREDLRKQVQLRYETEIAK